MLIIMQYYIIITTFKYSQLRVQEVCIVSRGGVIQRAEKLVVKPIIARRGSGG